MTNKAKNDGQVEGEGSYSGTKAYNKATEEFLKKGKVDEAAREAKADAAPGSKSAVSGCVMLLRQLRQPPEWLSACAAVMVFARSSPGGAAGWPQLASRP